jgi:hypothetical protein
LTEEILCLTCRHRRVACVPEPSCVSDATNGKRFHWRERWRQLKEERRAKENEIVDRNRHLPLGGEPWFHAWCEVKSREASREGDAQFVLAEHAFAVLHQACPLYEAAPPAEHPVREAVRPSAVPSNADEPPSHGWDSGRSF